MTGAERDTPSLVAWIWRTYLRKRMGWVAVATLLMALEGSMLGALSYLVRPMFDRVFVAGSVDAVPLIALGVAGVFMVRAFAAFTHRVIMQGVGQHVTAEIQRDMVRHLLTLDTAFFSANPPGTLIERTRGDTAAAANIWATVFGALARDIVSLIALLAVALSVDWVWTLIAVAGAPVLVLPILALQRFVRRTTRRARGAAAVLSTRLDEMFHGITTIKLNTSEQLERGRFDRSVRDYLKLEIRSRIGQAAIPAMIDIVAGLGFFGVLLYGGYQIVDGDKTVGEFMSFFTAMALLFDPLRRVANVTGAWQVAGASLERIRDIFEMAPEIVSPPNPAALPDDPAAADVVMENVVVEYGGEAALRGLSLTAKAGETTALVGASGAGKSTVFNTLTRLVDPSSGTVRVGGVDSRAMGLPELRSLFSVVSQDAPMFDESLRHNIVLNTKGVSEDQLRDALDAAALTEFVDGLPQGLDTLAGPRGSNLSGGQRQRVAIARAVLRDAPILLLDEATSALDSESEARVQAALERLSAGRTTLVIAHRLATIRGADKIVVMDNGRAVDEGRHDELLDRGGVYARLHALQFAE